VPVEIKKEKRKMKKVLFVMLSFAGSFIAADNANAQAGAKIGVFDIDLAVQGMPGYRRVDSLLAIYQQDSLRGDYDFAVKEYNRLDSNYKADSAAKKSSSVLNYLKEQRSQVAGTIVNFQQLAQQRVEQKRQELAAPLIERVLGAYGRVLKANNYLIVLKPNTYEMGVNPENVFEKVFREMKLPVPDQLRTQGPAQEQQPAGQSSAPAPRSGTARPAPRKP